MLDENKPPNELILDFFQKVIEGKGTLLLWYNSCFFHMYEICQYLGFFSPKLKANRWVSLFTSLGGICQGYSKANVTPYIHAMVYHVPRFMQKHDGIKKFTGQGKALS